VGLPPRPRGGLLTPPGAGDAGTGSPGAGRSRPGWGRRILRVLGLGLGGLGLLLFVATVGALIWARSAAGNRVLRDQLLGLLAPPHGTLTADGLETDLFSYLTLTDVVLADESGTVVGRVDTLSATFRLGGLPGKLLLVPTVRVDGIDLTLTDTGDGLDIAHVWDSGGPPSTTPYRGLPVDIVFSDIAITGARVHYRRPPGTGAPPDGGTASAGPSAPSAPSAPTEWGLDDATITGAVALRGNRVAWTGLTIHAAGTTPALGPLALAADGQWDPTRLWFDGVDLSLGANGATLHGGLGRLDGDATVGIAVDHLHADAPSLTPLFGAALPITGAFDATGSVSGRLRAPSAVLDIVTPDGTLTANAGADLHATPATWTATLVPKALGLSSFVTALADTPTTVSGTVSVDGAGFGWPDDLAATARFALTAPRVGPLTNLSAQGNATLADGVVEAPAFTAAADGAALSGGATVRILDESASARVGRVSLDLATLDHFGAPGGHGVVVFDGRVVAGWSAGTRIDADGAVAGSNVGWGDTLRAGAVRGPMQARWSKVDGVWAHGAFGLDTLALAPVGAVGARVDGTVTVATGGNVHVEGTGTLTGTTAPQVVADTMDFTGRFDRAGTGRMEADATVTLGRSVLLDGVVSDRGAADVHLRGDTGALTLDLFDGERRVVGVDGEVDLPQRAFRARRLSLAPTPAREWIGEGVQTVRLVDGGVEGLRLRLASGGTLVSAEGAGRRHGMLDLTVRVRDLRLGWLAELFPKKFAGYEGLVTMQASAEGHASHPQLLVDLSAADLVVPGAVRRVDVDLQAVGGDRKLQLQGAIATGGHALASLEGTLPFSLAVDDPGLITTGDLDLHLVLPPSPSSTWNTILPGSPLPELRASADISLTGAVLDPALGVVASVAAPLGQRGEWVRMDLDGTTTDRLFSLHMVGWERLERRAAIDGTVALHLDAFAKNLLAHGPAFDVHDPGAWAGAVALDVVPLRLPIQALSTFLPVPQDLVGDLSGGLHVSGTARAPRVEGALFLANGHMGGAPLSPALVSVVPAERGYHVDASLGFGAGGALSLTGFVPFDPTVDGDIHAELARDGLALDLSANDLPLAVVDGVWPPLEASAGMLRVNGHITGSLLDPVPDIHFGLDDGDFVLATTGVHYSHATVSGQLTHDSVVLDSLSVHTARQLADDALVDILGESGAADGVGAGTISGSMTARREGDHPVFTGALTVRRAWIFDLPDRVLRTDGVLTLANEQGKLRVTGTVSVVTGQFNIPERFFSAGGDLALDADVHVVHGPPKPTDVIATRAPAGTPFPDWIDLDVKVALARNLFLEAAVPMEQTLPDVLSTLSTLQVQSQLDGTVTASIHEGELSLVGEVVPIRGTAQLLGKQFELRGDSISFTGRDYADPVLNLDAVHTTTEYGNINARITGTPSAIAIAFTADDPRLAPEDVFAVLLVGSPTSEIGQGESSGPADQIVALLSAYVYEHTATAGAAAFDIFEFDATGSLRAGHRLGDKVFLLLGYNWVVDPAHPKNPVEATLEVQIDRHWQFDVTSGTAGITTIGLNRRWRF
jgi:hypothetical protein